MAQVVVPWSPGQLAEKFYYKKVKMDYISGWCNSERRLDGVTVVVTGANGGIGRETTADLFARGARVIMACRNLAKANAAKREIQDEALDKQNGTLHVEELDLSSFASIRSFAKRILANEKHLQILINNAGVMCCPESRTEDGFETHMGSNHLGPALLTLLLLPRLIESAPSRIIFVSSAVHFFYNIDFNDINYSKTPYVPSEAYSKSKTANILFATALARKLEECNIKNVTTYSVHPGIVYTDIDRHLWWVLSRGFRMRMLRWLWKTARCGAQTSLYCAVDENCANQSGLYYSDCAPCPPSSFCRNDQNVTRFWDHTMKMLGLQSFYPTAQEGG